MEKIIDKYIKEYYKPTVIRVMKKNETYESFEKSVQRSLDFQFYRLYYWFKNLTK